MNCHFSTDGYARNGMKDESEKEKSNFAPAYIYTYIGLRAKKKCVKFIQLE